MPRSALHAARDQELPLQPHARGRSGSRRHSAWTARSTWRNGSKRARLEADRIDAGEAPLLAGGVEHVGRRADLDRRQDRILLAPGVEAVAAHADRDVEIEPDRQAALARRARGSASSCWSRDPLHELVVRRSPPRWWRAACAGSGRSACRHSVGQSHHGLLEVAAQQLEAGELRRASRRARAGTLERLVPARLALPAEGRISEPQALPWLRPPRDNRPARAAAAPRPRRSSPAAASAGKFRYRLDVDVARIEKQAAARRIGAGLRHASSNSACSGLSPMPAAPRSAARSISAARSVKSPWPQLRRERTP